MMAMHDLNPFPFDKPRGAKNELELVRPRAGIEEGRVKLRDDRRKPAFGRAGNNDMLAEPMQFGG